MAFLYADLRINAEVSDLPRSQRGRFEDCSEQGSLTQSKREREREREVFTLLPQACSPESHVFLPGISSDMSNKAKGLHGLNRHANSCSIEVEADVPHDQTAIPLF